MEILNSGVLNKHCFNILKSTSFIFHQSQIPVSFPKIREWHTSRENFSNHSSRLRRILRVYYFEIRVTNSTFYIRKCVKKLSIFENLTNKFRSLMYKITIVKLILRSYSKIWLWLIFDLRLFSNCWLFLPHL